MTTRYLLDTDIVSDLVRHPQGCIAKQIEVVGDAAIITSIIVAAELRYGAAKKGSSRLTTQIDAILGAMEIVAFDSPMDAAYGSIRATLEQSGQPIGANDLLIAAQALTLDLTLVTANTREFNRVEKLRLENWLQLKN